MKLLRHVKYWLRAQNQAELAEEIEFHRAMGANLGNTTRARGDARARLDLALA